MTRKDDNARFLSDNGFFSARVKSQNVIVWPTPNDSKSLIMESVKNRKDLNERTYDEECLEGSRMMEYKQNNRKYLLIKVAIPVIVDDTADSFFSTGFSTVMDTMGSIFSFVISPGRILLTFSFSFP